MVQLWAVRVDETPSEEQRQQMRENLPLQRLARLARLAGTEKEIEVLAAYWILRRALEEQYSSMGALPVMERGKAGKPFFPGLPSVHFSISHTPGGVLVGLSEAEIGVDIERARQIHPRLLARLGCADEAEFLKSWVRREAQAKRLAAAVSLGEEEPLAPGEQLWQSEVFPGYRACASYTEAGKIRLSCLYLADTFN